MANTYYDSQLTAAEIEAVLKAINGILTPANNGKVLAINNGKLEARSVQWGGGEPTIEPLTVTANGTYTATSGIDGYSPIVVNVSGGGGGDIPLLSDSQWHALTSQQKRSYGLVAIQDAITGYIRGKLVNGANYIGEIVQSGTGSASISDSIIVSGSYVLVVLALNSEASTYQLDIDAKINGSSITGETIIFNSYSGSGTNRRNYRLNQYSVTVSSGDTISIEVTDRSGYSSFVWALIDASALSLDKAISTADATAFGTNVNSGFVLMGTFDSSSGGTIELEGYTANDTVITANPGTNYKSAYIFWFV